MKSYSRQLVVFLFLLFSSFSAAHAAVECKKLKAADFEKKTVEIANKLVAAGIISKSALTFTATGTKRTLNAVCKTHETPHFGDGGPQCTFKCDINGEESMSAILFENFNSRITLSEIKYDINH